MSKLLDTLDSVGQTSPEPLGFGIAARRESGTALAVVGILRKRHPGLEKLIAEDCLAAVLLVGDGHEGTIKALDNVPWGIWPDSLAQESVVACGKKGRDFLVARPQYLPAGLDDDLACFLAVEPDMDDRFLRTIEDLPVDGILLTLGGIELPVTVQHLMTVGVVRTMFEKHLLVEVPPGLREKELEALKNMGVSGIAIDVEGLSAKALRELGQRIKALPQRRAPQRARGSAVPYVMPSRPVGVPEGDDEGEDEF